MLVSSKERWEKLLPPIRFQIRVHSAPHAADLSIDAMGLATVQEMLRPISGIRHNTNASVPGPSSGADDRRDVDRAGRGRLSPPEYEIAYQDPDDCSDCYSDETKDECR